MAQQIIRSIGSDGKEVLSNILDKYTGEAIEFKEIDYIPEIYDGIIYINKFGKNFKRQFNVIDLRSFGLIGDGITDNITAINKAFALDENLQFIIGGNNGTYVFSDGINMPIGTYLNLNNNSIVFKYSGRDKYGINANDYCTIENGNIEILHDIPDTNPTTGQFLSCVNIGEYANPTKAYNGLILRNLNLKKNVRGNTITCLASNCTFENIKIDRQGYAGIGIVLHWSNTGAIKLIDGKYEVVGNTYHPHNITIQNIQFFNGLMTGDNSAIFCSSVYNTTIKNIININSYSRGVVFGSGEFSNYASTEIEKPLVGKNNTITDVIHIGGVAGVAVTGGGNAEFMPEGHIEQADVSIDNLICENVTSTGVFLAAVTDVNLNNINIANCGTYGIQIILGMRNVIANNVVIEDTDRGGLVIGNQGSTISKSIYLTNVKVRGSNKSLGSSHNIDISGNPTTSIIMSNIELGYEDGVETAIRNINLNTIAPTILSNIIINGLSDSGGGSILGKGTTMLDGYENKMVISNIISKSVKPIFPRPQTFLSEFSFGIPVYKLARSYSKDISVEKEGATVYYTNPIEGGGIGSVLCLEGESYVYRDFGIVGLRKATNAEVSEGVENKITFITPLTLETKLKKGALSEPVSQQAVDTSDIVTKYNALQARFEELVAKLNSLILK